MIEQAAHDVSAPNKNKQQYPGRLPVFPERVLLIMGLCAIIGLQLAVPPIRYGFVHILRIGYSSEIFRFTYQISRHRNRTLFTLLFTAILLNAVIEFTHILVPPQTPPRFAIEGRTGNEMNRVEIEHFSSQWDHRKNSCQIHRTGENWGAEHGA